MRKIYLYLLILAGLGSLLTGCSSSADKSLPPSALVSSKKLEVSQKQEIDLADVDIHSLTPDGKSFLGIKDSMFCLYDVKSLQKGDCVDIGDKQLDSFYLSWSPDGSKAALTEMYYEKEESDIWVLDFKKGEMKNLTEDNLEGSYSAYLNNSVSGKWETDPVQVDYLPSWSQDGKKLAFARFSISNTEWEGTGIYTISASGGEPELVFGIHSPYPEMIQHSIFFSGSDSRLIFGYENEDDLEQTGIWGVDADGKNAGQLKSFENNEENVVRIFDITPDGSKALLVYPNILNESFLEANVCAFYILDLQNNTLTPLKTSESGEFEFVTVVTADFSPDGSKAAYVYLNSGNQFVLAVRDLASETENILASNSTPFGVSFYSLKSLTWADNDAIFLGSDSIDGYLYRIVTKE